jgi:hypothetical protein
MLKVVICMECPCEEKETYCLKVEGDVGADPIWCNNCGCNLDIDEIPLSNQLKDELIRWALKYGEWIDWDTDTVVENGIELENKHNEMGLKLTEKVKKELGDKYVISFSLSTSARRYANQDFR